MTKAECRKKSWLTDTFLTYLQYPLLGWLGIIFRTPIWGRWDGKPAYRSEVRRIGLKKRPAYRSEKLQVGRRVHTCAGRKISEPKNIVPRSELLIHFMRTRTPCR